MNKSVYLINAPLVSDVMVVKEKPTLSLVGNA